MKQLQSSLFFFFLVTNLFAQTDFMPVGSILQTSYSSMVGRGKAVFNAEKDTLIYTDLSFRKIVITKKDVITNRIFTEKLYLHQKGDSIFEYSPNSPQRMYFLFKNRYSVGDSFLIQGRIPAIVYIDSVIQKNNIKRYVARMKIPPRFLYPETFLRVNFYDKFLPDFNWFLEFIAMSGFYDGQYYRPHCYTDNNTAYQTPYLNAQICTISDPTTTISDLKPTIDLTFFPNPADTYLKIESNQKQAVHLSIFNTDGKMILAKTVTLPLNLPIYDVPNGLYIVKIRDEKGLVLHRKLMVQH